MLRNASLLLRGMVIAQIIGFLALPVLSRVLPVEAFGQVQVYLSIISIGLVFTGMRYEIALLRCRTIGELLAVLQLCFLINLAVAVVAGAAYQVARTLGWSSTISNLSFGGGALALGLLISGLVQTLGVAMTREEAFSDLARSRILQSISYAGTGFGSGYVAPSQTTLIWVDIISKGGASLYLLQRLRKTGIEWNRSPRIRRIVAVARKYRHYAMLTVPGSLLGALSLALVPLGIFTLYGPHAAGQYGLMDRAVLLPVNLIVVALSQAFTARLARDLRNGAAEASSMFRDMIWWSALVGLVPTFVAYWLISPAVIFLFGNEWSLAAEIAQILVLYNYANFVVGSVLQTFVVAGAQRRQIAWDFCRFLAAIATWATILGAGLGIKAALALHYGVQAICYLAYLVMGYRLLERMRGHKSTGQATVSPTIV